MATSYQLTTLSYTTSGESVILSVGIFAANAVITRDPTTGVVSSTVPQLDTITVNGSLYDTVPTWEALAVEAFSEWCRQRVYDAGAKATLAASLPTILTLPDPTGN